MTKVYIQESCPRDGWQNYASFIPTDRKIHYIKAMCEAGVKQIEVTSFVSQKIMPQMADAEEVFAAVKNFSMGQKLQLSALALNAKGAARAEEAGAEVLEFVLSASEEHNLRNSRRPLSESMQMFKELALAPRRTEAILCIACFFGSPFGDVITQERMQWLLAEAQSVGITKFGLADTAGICNPKHMRETLRFLKEQVDLDNISIHLHDTYGMGIANAYVALEEGVTHFDASLAGMGGCPFAPGAKGNIATEDLVQLCHSLGLETGCDLERLKVISKAMTEELGIANNSSVTVACSK